jgi:cbb3-type cytochrome oxidase cytochrome c subunit
MNKYLYRYLSVAVISFMVGIPMLSNLAQPASSKRQGGQASTKSSGGHGDHHTPEGWKFAWPQGAPVKGREVFVKLQCYSCHEVKGEKFPAPSGEVGPELSVMGPVHEAEYFAEAIINPNAVIEKGKGYEAADGSSKMPSYNELATVQEVIDLVAYLKGLKSPADTSAGHGGGSGSSGGHSMHGRH